ncbi:polysaccharide deacetylase [Arthrobacter sp. MYb211]|uniref:polysaccharide deacetylase n=1 Tax=Micrococcaceae TaxID=1268 RepID=UPI000BB75638|nr:MULTISPECIES: polysaccharide deacetylase [Micrococcaceae]PCC27172.1 polysaccharide deacetylase [Glutamicibacter sp. BW80]PQZ97343.1 polysaccharide deacetylase [Arthrobacter sp. MYb224]PRA00868.1 polysaccharide deacetylase [Arthrobacter sp. MYb229]PRA10814.1 polysaccharide deacetylase [Arthrobacter sp. MYb221]PRB48802.1 polysaccharide deacetylase [Arthrobacter sp. MYb216]
MKHIKIAVVATVVLALAGCSDQVDPEIAASSASQAAVEAQKAADEAAREEGVLAQINRLADGYDYNAAIKLAEEDPSAKLNDLVRGLESEKKGTSAWEHPDQIPHLFFHSLVVDPKRAFDKDNRAQGYRDYMVTQKEFEAILQELHSRDFVLVNPADFAGLDKKKNMSYREIMLPAGKKPIVLSLDDLSYYEYMEGDGFADRLVLDKKGNVRNEYVDGDGKKHVGAYDVTTVLDDFVAEHPDFSYRDARGIIAMTGYNGVFGYRTSQSQYPDSKNLKKDREEATKIAEAMKKEGWVFASHSWGHIATGTVSLGRFKRDMKLWKDEVEPILGETDQFIYPFGSDIARTGSYSGARFELLKKEGFMYFYGVDGTITAWMQQRDDYQRQMRINVDGLQFDKEQRGDRPVLKSFFDVAEVIDSAR